ncbi:hypothetical protein ENUP19_0181G0024 [Entamoeba nuttalli]|uniref:Nucleosome assembly protein, putative n=2 Tax=Entamoeba nuttalli TaxID=412467 RepID=K2G710_ENTNP|nr:nucleosome assembly protein, putative [Entamoeba nuttalli P19]EKE38141.1 nucleosome assembly protein, putative [Entamoeba nuttalli P19]|eukprot:XP_008859515.1 nucleosome assembly protein, putative [Entamoeba nuttalli P19]
MSDLIDLATKSYEEYMTLVDEQVHKNYHACTKKMKEIQKLRLVCERARYEAMSKFNEEASKIYGRMNEIITGNAQPTEDELEGYIKSDELVAQEGSQFNKGIPVFWFQVLKNSMLFDSANGSEADISVLIHLKNIRIEYMPLEDVKNKDGEDTLKYHYKVHFDFEPNEYFTNETITVSVQCKLCEAEGEFDEPAVITETPIEWHKDKDVRYKLVKRRGGKRGGRGRPAAAVRQKVESFFDLFYTPALPENLNLEEMEEVDEDVIICHTNFKIFMELINEVYPMALSFFDESMAEPDDEDMDDEDMDDDCDDDCDCEGHDDEDDDDDEEDKPHGNTSNTTAPPVPQECPQQ